MSYSIDSLILHYNNDGKIADVKNCICTLDRRLIRKKENQKNEVECFLLKHFERFIHILTLLCGFEKTRKF
jgi:hypothetical protein